MKGFRTKEGGLGKAFGASGASDVLLNAAIRSRKDEAPSSFD
jgi:hypothetical protein